MSKLEFFVVAHSVSIDRTTNRCSVFEIVEDLKPRSLPSAIPKLAIVGLWNFTDEELNKDHQVVFRATSPGESTAIEFRINIAPTNRRHRVMQYIVGMPIKTTGELKFEARLNDAHQADHIVFVHAADETQLDDNLLPLKVDESKEL